MPDFLNIDLSRKIEVSFLKKHIVFSLFWILGILLFIFRIDLLIIGTYPESLKWLQISLPISYLALLFIYLYSIKWYYILAYIFYPILVTFWFIPKTVLSVGKIYLLGNYVNSIYSKLSKPKIFAFNIAFFLFSLVFLLTIKEKWTRWLSIICLSYFYLNYIYKFLKKSFKKPSLFGKEIEDTVKVIIDNRSIETSILMKSIIRQDGDNKLDISSRKKAEIKRTVISNYAIELLTDRLNGHRGRQAYLVSWIFSAIIFLLYSIIFFTFLNFQLYEIDPSNFVYTGNLPKFDFFYYTLKTITFGDIELIKPQSVLARINEISSFFTMGIFILVIVTSILLSMNQDRVNENIKLTTELIKNENTTLIEFLKNEYGMEIKSALLEIKNIDTSLKKTKNIIDNIL